MNGWKTYVIGLLTALVLAMAGYAWSSLDARVTVLEAKYESVLALKVDIEHIKNKVDKIDNQLQK